MMPRHALLTLFGIGISAFALSAASPVWAANRTFTPVTSWSISRIEPANNGTPYCTLARRFDGNTVITFARNTNGEGTIAIDFQQPLFDPNQTYRIGLQAGQGLKREFMTRPATPNALVLRTGQDPQFFTALSSSNEMGLLMDNNRYAFAIPDFGSGTGQLTGCIGNGPTVITTPQPVVANAPHAPESDAVAQLRAELDALKQENAGIVASLKKDTAAPDPQLRPNPENDQLMAKLSSLESEKNALVEKLQTERSRQQQEAQDEQTLKAALEEQKSLQTMLNSERQQRAELEKALTDKTAEAEKRGELRARIEQLEASNAELKTLRETLDTERSRRLAAEKSLQDQKASLEDQERLRARVSELETQNKTLQQTATQFEDTKVKLVNTQERASMEEARRQAAEQALKEMQLSVSKNEAAVEELKKKIEDERAKMATADAAKQAETSKKHADEMARLNAEIEKLQSESASIKNDMTQKAQTEQARREATEKELQSVRASLSSKETEIAKLSGIKAQHEVAEKELQEARANLASKETEIAKLSAAEQQHEAAEKELQAVRADLTSKQNELEKINAERKELMAQVEKEKAQGAISADLQQRINAEQARREATEKELEKMRADIADKQTEIAKLNAAQAELATVRENLQVKQSELEKIAAERKELIAQVEKEKAQGAISADLQQRVDTEQARRAATEKELAMMRADLASKQDEIAKLNGAQSELKTVREDLEKAAAERKELLAQLAKQEVQKSANDDLSQKAITEQARREATEKELRQVRESLTAKDSELAKISGERADLLAQVEKIRTEAAQSRVSAQDNGKVKELSARLAELESHNSDLMTQLQSAKAQTQAAEKAAVTTTSNDAITNEKISEIGRQAEADRKELQALLETEQARRKKLESIMAKGGSETDRIKEMDAQIAQLQKHNNDLEKRLREEQNNINPAAGDDQEIATLRKQLSVLKSDNQMLAEKLATVGHQSKSSAQEAQVVYAGDDKMADALAETKSSLASVVAERDEYRDLLQRERLGDKKTTGKKDTKADEGANARIAELEAERADLVKKLEYERSRIEQIAAGKEPMPAGDANEGELQERLASVEAEKTKLKKQLEIAQRDVIDARERALKSGGATDSDVAALLDENKKLQTELAASAQGGSNADSRAMATEIAALRAQNNVLSEEINKRLAAAPTRAAMDNAAAEANFKMKTAKTAARQEVASDMQIAQTRFQQAEAENIRLSKELAQAKGAKGMAPIMSNDQPMANPPAMYTPASVSNDVGPSGQDIAGYLKRSGIPMVSGFEKIRKVSNAQFGAFRWDTGVVFGTAEQQRLPSAQSFDQAINAYLQKTQQRCSGTFDQSFDPSQMTGTRKNFAVADVACVMPDGTGAGAAMVFFYKDGMFNAVAHEGDISHFDQAMSTRDALARFMQGVI